MEDKIKGNYWHRPKSERPLGNIISFVLAISLPLLVFGIKGSEKTKTHIPENTLIYANKIKREYAGKLRIYPTGAEQDIYTDEKPFGVLDEVKTKGYSKGGYEAETKRKPNAVDESRFEIIEYFTRKDHPALFR